MQETQNTKVVQDAYAAFGRGDVQGILDRLDDSIVWGTRATWGDEIIWGTTFLGYDDRGVLVYGDAIDWRLVTPDSLVWGSLGGTTNPSSTEFNTLWNPVF